MTALLVTVAGGLGVLARHLLSSALQGPWTVVAINVAGSFLLGLLVAAAWASPQARTVAGAGFLGGFTTFSTFSVQVVSDLDAGRPAHALAYLLVSVVSASSPRPRGSGWPAACSADQREPWWPAATRTPS